MIFILFAADSWCAVFEGMGLRPRDYDHSIDSSGFTKVQQILQSSAAALQAAAHKVPSHEDYLQHLLQKNIQPA